MAILLAVASSFCFGLALVTARIGLRSLDARAGAAISVPTAAVLLALIAPFALDLSDFQADGAIVFALVGLFFPAVVTLLTFRSNETLGPTVTGAVSGTAPLFAIVAASLVLGERIPPLAGAAAVAVSIGIGMLSWDRRSSGGVRPGWRLLWPLAGAFVRGLAQVGAKAGLLLWPNPFAASLIGYTVSCAIVLPANRLREGGRRIPARASVAWFAATGALNGTALLLMYSALSMATVSIVAPIVAAYPVVTAIASAIALPGETLTARALTGSAITVAAIVCLVALR